MDALLDNSPYWKYVDLQWGVYARGYETNINPRQQWFLGVGLNLEEIAKHLGIGGIRRVMHYWQPTHTAYKYNQRLDH